MMSRYYNIDIKRFINQDSLLGSISNALSTNQYAYLKGNPINYVDPQGTRPVDPDGNTTSEMYPELQISKGMVEVDVGTVIDSATAARKGGESVVGHALQKHAGRNPDIWGKVKGGADQINQTGLDHLNDILNGVGDFAEVTTD